jgi:hypothetical protein
MQPVIRKDPSNPTDQTIEMQNALIITPRDMHPEATTESASKKKEKESSILAYTRRTDALACAALGANLLCVSIYVFVLHILHRCQPGRSCWVRTALVQSITPGPAGGLCS